MKAQETHQDSRSTKKTVTWKPIPCYLLLSEAINLDNDSILFDELDAATSWLHMCARVVDLAHNTISGWDISGPTSSIAGTFHDDPVAHIITPTDLDKVSTMVDIICHCLTSYATN
jgi:hypothetical protein